MIDTDYPIASLGQLIKNLGFDEHPFQYTNAEQEDRLPKYFVSPPYFASVFGNPEMPRPFIVYAPRGGGKTAQRRMIELRCSNEKVLAITYDEFEFPELTRASDIRLHHHLKKIVRSCLVGILLTLKEEPQADSQLTKQDKQLILQLSAEHLIGTGEIEYEQTLRSLKSLKERFKESWNEWVPIAGTLANVLLGVLKKFVPLENIGSLSKFRNEEYAKSDSLKHQLRIASTLVRKIGWRSIYILIDRVDEAELTGNNFNDSFKLIEPLLKDLQLLEFEGIGFKFFLWDMLEPSCKNIVRTDRIEQETLFWQDQLLKQMWETRLEAYSNKNIQGLDQISEKTVPFSVDELAFIFANHSPRDLVRIGSQILQEQTELDPRNNCLSEIAIYTGIEKFASRRAIELFTKDRVLKELRRIGQVDFTIPYLANVIFREKQASTRNRIKIWREQGAIIDIERIIDTNSKQDRPVKLIAISDIRVAKTLYPTVSISDFLQSKYRKCPSCNTKVLRDWGDPDSSSICQSCQADLMAPTDSVEPWKRKELAAESRYEYRSEIIQIATQSEIPFNGFIDTVNAEDDE